MTGNLSREITVSTPLLQLLVASLDKMRPRNAQLQVYNESALTLEKLSILKAWAEVYVVSMKNEIATYTPGPAPQCLGRNFLEFELFTMENREKLVLVHWTFN